MKTFAGAALISAATAFSNSRPIYGTYPGWIEGQDSLGIQIELFEDYLCSDCLAFNPVMEELLQTEWNGKTVGEQVGVGLTPFPLPYHVHSYQVAQLVPYFMDLCVESANATCLSNEYKDFAFTKQGTILSMKDTSQNDFIDWWSEQVATQFGMETSQIQDAYTSRQYDTDGSTRVFLKYAWSKGVFGTPTAFVNGVMLDTVPMTVDGWIELLDEVYGSQPKAIEAFLQ